MENLESKYVSDYSNKNINRYTYNGEKPSLKHSSTKPEYMNQGKIIIISGPSASGKSAIIDSLVSLNKNYIKATPATSRNKRPGEKPNQDYYFLSEQEFVQKIVHSLMYCLSSFTTSSKSVMLLRPLTCHIPVSPGLVARRAR